MVAGAVSSQSIVLRTASVPAELKRSPHFFRKSLPLLLRNDYQAGGIVLCQERIDTVCLSYGNHDM
jgi:hypothetical protein